MFPLQPWPRTPCTAGGSAATFSPRPSAAVTPGAWGWLLVASGSTAGPCGQHHFCITPEATCWEPALSTSRLSPLSTCHRPSKHRGPSSQRARWGADRSEAGSPWQVAGLGDSVLPRGPHTRTHLTGGFLSRAHPHTSPVSALTPFLLIPATWALMWAVHRAGPRSPPPPIQSGVTARGPCRGLGEVPFYAHSQLWGPRGTTGPGPLRYL